MAKQVGPFTITGCYDTICFYKMDGVYYARMKSSLTGKRVKKDPAFRRTMEYAGLLGQASRIASALYRDLPIQKKRERTVPDHDRPGDAIAERRKDERRSIGVDVSGSEDGTYNYGKPKENH